MGDTMHRGENVLYSPQLLLLVYSLQSPHSLDWRRTRSVLVALQEVLVQGDKALALLQLDERAQALVGHPPLLLLLAEVLKRRVEGQNAAQRCTWANREGEGERR